MRRAIHLVTMFAVAAFCANAATTTLYQYGWDLGGPLTITFTADDTNGDGAYDLGELTAFNASFALPGSTDTINFGLPEVNTGDFYYADPSDYFIVAGDLGNVLRTENSLIGPLGIVSWDFNAEVAFSSEALRSSPVPEPASVLLVGIPLATAIRFRRRKDSLHR